MSWKVTVIVGFLLVTIEAGRPFIGLNVPTLDSRIVGGLDATPGQFPYQVSLQWGIPPLIPYSHFCGGSILNNRWIITAGHCINAVPIIGNFVVKAGKLNITAKEPEQKIIVKKSFIHPNYTGGVAPYDIALILLQNPLVFNKNVSALSLPKFEEVPKDNLILSGWGSISKTNVPKMPRILQYVRLPVIDLKTCKTSIELIAGPSPLHETNVCTGPLTGGYAPCSGDSGGPLVLEKTNGTAELIGIVSWGIIPCGSRGAPSVYTRTSAFINWITVTLNNNS